MIQACILILSCLSIGFICGKRKKIGYILGLCSEPFWLYSTFTNNEWGIFVVSIWFCVSYIRGLTLVYEEKEIMTQLCSQRKTCSMNGIMDGEPICDEEDKKICPYAF